MSALIEKNPKFNAYTFDDLVRLGNIGDEEAILELGLRVLYNDDDLIHPDDCPDCGCDCDEQEDKIEDLESENNDLRDELKQLKNDIDSLLAEEN